MKQNALPYDRFFSNPTLRTIALAGFGALLVALCAQINIPLEPVPITLQTVGVMLIALTFERKTALQAILCYLALGAMGAPVFSDFSGGLSVLLGTTGGYCLGFVACVAAMTTLRLRLDDQNFLHIALNCLLGTIIIFIFGVTRLSLFVGFETAIQVGLLPFILPGFIKMLLLASTLRYLRPK